MDYLVNYNGTLYLNAAQANINGGHQAAAKLFSPPIFIDSALRQIIAAITKYETD